MKTTSESHISEEGWLSSFLFLGARMSPCQAWFNDKPWLLRAARSAVPGGGTDLVSTGREDWGGVTGPGSHSWQGQSQDSGVPSVPAPTLAGCLWGVLELLRWQVWSSHGSRSPCASRSGHSVQSLQIIKGNISTSQIWANKQSIAKAVTLLNYLTPEGKE